MAKPPSIRRLRTEDFSPEDRQLIERISYSINDFLDQVVFLFTKGVDFTNLNQQLQTIDIVTNSSGELPEAITIRTDLKTKVAGGMLIGLTNNTNSSILPTSQPFISVVPVSTSQAQLQHISGLTANTEYTIKIMLIGENI